jgi:hypothetical protein
MIMILAGAKCRDHRENSDFGVCRINRDLRDLLEYNGLVLFVVQTTKNLVL